MNDIEKAIETLKMENALMQFDLLTGEDYLIELQNKDIQDLYIANLIAIKTLKKQIPKKPNIIKAIYSVFRCPECDNRVGGEDESGVHGFNYCPNCSQKIDWLEAEELNHNGYIDDVDLDGIAEEIADEIKNGVLNVLDTYIMDLKNEYQK